MCGLVAVLSPGEPVSAETIRAGIGALDHRGPDESGLWLSESRDVALGHARLSIIDLTTGQQPLSNESGDVWAIVNGEFYDYQRLQNELVGRGHRLKSTSDSEVLIHLYEEQGISCIERLRGEFAFVLWDQRNGLLFAARDHFGTKPLVFSRHGGRLWLASEAKALFAMGVPAEWDREAMFQQLTVICDQDRTPFRDVFQIRPGQYLMASRNHTRMVRYWDLDYPRIGEQCDNTLNRPAPAIEAEHVERLRATFSEAVRLRLRADVPVGCYLSGGLDSSTILTIAAQMQGHVDAFTICFDSERLNEERYARMVAEHTGATFHACPVTEDALADAYSDAVWHVEGIDSSCNSVSKYILSRLVRERGYKVVLVGQGADEVFAGYDYFKADAVRHGVGRITPSGGVLPAPTAGGFPSFFPADTAPFDTRGLAATVGYVPLWFSQRAVAAGALRYLFSADFSAEFAERDPYSCFIMGIEVADQLRDRSVLHQSLYLYTKSLFTHQMLGAAGDRTEMAHSIEGRLPFLDQEVVREARELPTNMLLNSDGDKWVVRQLASAVLPGELAKRPKFPFATPRPPQRKDGKFYQLLQDTVHGDALRATPFFDRDKVIALVERFWDFSARDRARCAKVFSTILSACFLQERFRL